MARPRARKRGFRPIGAVRPSGLGLSRRRTRELALVHAWRTVAGPALAEHATAAVRRGLLEVAAADETWRAALEPLMPRIAARLAREFPDLEARAWRLRVDGRRDAGPVRSIAAGASPPGPAIARSAAGTGPADPGGEPMREDEDEDAIERLRRVAARYLERSR